MNLDASYYTAEDCNNFYRDSEAESVQNKSNKLLYMNNSQAAEVNMYQISSLPNDPFHYMSLSSAKKENTGFLPIAPKPIPALRNILPADFMPSIALQKFKTPARMFEMRLDTNVNFPEKQDCLSLNWETFRSGCPMMDYGSVYTCINDTILHPQSDIHEDMQLAIAGSQSSLWDPKSKKPCNCTRSQCLKLYCDCFANGEFCNNCNCNNCCNNLHNKEECFKAIRAKILCSNCKCIGCKNYEESPHCTTLRNIQKHLDTERIFSIFTSLDVVRAACACLLAQAEKAEEEKQSACIAEQMIIEEFGNCLAQM